MSTLLKIAGKRLLVFVWKIKEITLAEKLERIQTKINPQDENFKCEKLNPWHISRHCLKEKITEKGKLDT